jgi:hypothetical protein
MLAVLADPLKHPLLHVQALASRDLANISVEVVAGEPDIRSVAIVDAFIEVDVVMVCRQVLQVLLFIVFDPMY